MLSILVASSKGGCGKTTIATHLAAYFALAGKRTVLVDADPQHSATRWCERRAALEHAVLPLDGRRRGWEKTIPDDAQRLIVDAPAGAQADDLEAALLRVDCVVVPVLPSVIDMEATGDFVSGLGRNATVRRRKLPVALVGRACVIASLATWPYPQDATLRDSQAYVLLCGPGKSLFDYHSENVRGHQEDWDGLMKWLRKVNRSK